MACMTGGVTHHNVKPMVQIKVLHESGRNRSAGRRLRNRYLHPKRKPRSVLISYGYAFYENEEEKAYESKPSILFCRSRRLLLTRKNVALLQNVSDSGFGVPHCRHTSDTPLNDAHHIMFTIQVLYTCIYTCGVATCGTNTHTSRERRGPRQEW
jgi:hypothetical protein